MQERTERPRWPAPGERVILTQGGYDMAEATVIEGRKLGLHGYPFIGRTDSGRHLNLGREGENWQAVARSAPDIEFTRSTFGGGWASPKTDLGADVLAEMFPGECTEVGSDPWPEGWIMEPYEVEALAETANEAGARVRLVA